MRRWSSCAPQIRAADAVLFCTPEYAGSLPGSFKNLLDWTVGGGEIYAKPVAWINVSGRPRRRRRGAHDTLRTVLGYTGADIVESACAQIPVTHDAVGDDGLITDPAIRAQIERVLSELATYAARRDSE